jgi:Concanavalin A-like lectin/glucanases superfamily
MPFKRNTIGSTITTIVPLTGVITPAQELAMVVGINKNNSTGEVWIKDTLGVVTKVQEKIKDVPEETINSFALANASQWSTLSESDIEKMADMLVAGKSKWASVHHMPSVPSRLPYVKKFIQILKNKGLKVHLRAHEVGTFQNRGYKKHEDIFSKGKATSGTLSSITDTSKNWTVDEFKDFQCYTTNGTGSGQGLYITSNTSNTLNFIGFGPFAPSSVAFDNTTEYNISYELYTDNTFTSTKYGYYKYTKDLALLGHEVGADSFSCANEIPVFINQLPGNIFENDDKTTQAQKDLVGYVKSQMPAGAYPDGITITDVSWRTDNWIGSGSIAPLDFLAYTAYDAETEAMHAAQKLVKAFGKDKIQVDEFALSRNYSQGISQYGAVDNETHYAELLNRRYKWLKYLGIRNVFRWELWDDSGTGGDGGAGFGYIKKLGNVKSLNDKESWFAGSYGRVIDTKITDWCIGFRVGRKTIEIPSNVSMNLTDKLTIQCWFNPSDGVEGTLWKKDGSFLLRYEEVNNSGRFTSGALTGQQRPGKLAAYLWTGGTGNLERKATDYFDILDRWIHIAYTYDGVNHKIYINGKEAMSGAKTGNIDNNTQTLCLGGQPGGGETISARMQDFEMCNTVLYTGNFTPPTAPPNNPSAVVRLLLNEGTGTVVKDTSGKGNDGVLAGTYPDQCDWFIGMRDTIKDVQPGIVTGGGTTTVIGLTNVPDTAYVNQAAQITATPNNSITKNTNNQDVVIKDNTGVVRVIAGQKYYQNFDFKYKVGDFVNGNTYTSLSTGGINMVALPSSYGSTTVDKVIMKTFSANSPASNTTYTLKKFVAPSSYTDIATVVVPASTVPGTALVPAIISGVTLSDGDQIIASSSQAMPGVEVVASIVLK